MLKKNSLCLALIIAAIIVIFGQSNLASAQSAGIKISPVKIEDVVEPGQTVSQAVKVTNESASNQVFYVYLRDFKAEGESGSAKLIAPGTEEGYYLSSWLDITSQGIEFAPNEEKVIPFQVHVPDGTGPGGYFGAILFGTEPPKLNQNSEDKGAGMSVAHQTACLVLLRVKGDVNETAQIREFNTNKDFFSTPFSVDFMIRIENEGNVHIKPYGVINIINMFGKEVAAVPVNDGGGNILPNSIRRFSDIKWEGKNAFGKYTAKLALTYGTPVDKGGQGQDSLTSAKDFWIIPWRYIIPALLGLIVSLGVFYLLLRVYRNKAVRKAMQQAGLSHVKYVRKYQGPSPALHLSLILIIVFMVLFIIVSATYFLLFA
jgi:hypothetical protein